MWVHFSVVVMTLSTVNRCTNVQYIIRVVSHSHELETNTNTAVTALDLQTLLLSIPPWEYFTLRQERDERVKCATVVSPAMQAQDRTAMIRTPDSASDLSPGDLHTQI